MLFRFSLHKNKHAAPQKQPKICTIILIFFVVVLLLN